MDVLTDDQVLQANLGRFIDGLDNDALDIKQFEDFINGADSFFPEDTGPYGGALSSNGRSAMDGSGVKTEPGAPLPTTATASTVVGGTTTGPPQYLQQGPPPPGVLQDHTVVQQPMLNTLHQNATYCSQLPDSPPDSGSEPYSPPDGNHQTDSCNVKASIVSNMSLPPQQLYPAPPAHHGPPAAHTSVSPPHHSSPPNPQAVPAHTNPKQYGSYGAGEPPKLNHPPTSVPQNPSNPMGSQLPPHMMSPYPNLTGPTGQQSKKRKFSDSPNNTVTPGVMNGMGGVNGLLNNIKQEPGLLPDCDDDYTYDMPDTGGMFLDGTYQVIKWQAFQPTKWSNLLDVSLKELPAPSYRVDADKGFNFSVPDDAFVCQKKNHFQVTVHIGLAGDPKYVKTPDGPKPIDSYYVHFKGVKVESQSQTIRIEQSQSDRSKKAFYPVRADLSQDNVTKLTVGRLHFSETTTNNMRKKGKPNPDQRYFMLVVALHAHSGSDDYVIAAHVSERIIVRASNPGQFDNDVDVLWAKGHTPDSVYHAGRVGINTDRPDEALTVHGNIKLTGHLVQPSDKRAKKDITELDSKEQLKNVTKLKVYKYEYEENFAEHAGLSEDELEDTGVLAQEVQTVLPDAVRETGDVILPNGNRIDNFLVVNKDRIYMENVGAVKELCKLTDNLENRIDELEKMNKKLTKLKRMDSVKSTGSTRSLSTISTISRSPSVVAGKKHHKPRSGHNSSSEEGGLCSNRFIQITVIVLVLVMAFCLVSITTLYIMEKQKSTSDDPPFVVEGSNPTPSLRPPGGGSGNHTRSEQQGTQGSTTSLPISHSTWAPTHQMTLPPSSTIGATGPIGPHKPAGPAGPLPETGLPDTVIPAHHGPVQETNQHNQTNSQISGPSAPATARPSGRSDVHIRGPSGPAPPKVYDQPSIPAGSPGSSWPERGPMGPAGSLPDGEPTRMPRGPPAAGGMSHSGQPPDIQEGYIPSQVGKEDDARRPEIGQHETMIEHAGPEETVQHEDKGHMFQHHAGGDSKSNLTTVLPPNVTVSENGSGTIWPDPASSPSPAMHRDTGPHAHPTPLTPPRCLRDLDACQTFCCPIRMDNPPQDNPEVINNDVPGAQAAYPVNDYTDSFPHDDLPPSNPQDTAPVPTPKPAKSSSETEDAPNEALDDPYQPTLHTSSDPKIQLRIGGDTDGYGIRRRRAAHDAGANTATSQKAILRFRQTNRTVGDSLCTNEACRLGSGGNYTYAIPVSQYFPAGFVTLEFIVWAGEDVKLCGGHEQHEELCSMTSDNSFTDTQGGIRTTTAGPNNWDLPVGYYSKSSFRFRVSQPAVHSDVCLLSASEVGQSYDEYSLHFYRMCDGIHFS